MNKNNLLSLQRLMQLIINDIKINQKHIVIIASTLAILLLIMPYDLMVNLSLYKVMLYAGGVLITGSIFNDLHDPLRANAYLMLPCSNLERFLSKWILSAPGYALTLLVAYYILAWASFLITSFIFNHYVVGINLWQSNLWESIGEYILLQSIFLLGAAYFKRFTLIKTVLCLGLSYLSYIILVNVLAHAICLNCIWPWLRAHGLYPVLLGVIAIICWTATYFKLTEKELL